MILAVLDHNKQKLPKIPKICLDWRLSEQDVETFQSTTVSEENPEGVPFGAKEWLIANYADPHRDRGWANKLFFTLVVKAEHNIGDGVSAQDDYPIRGGEFLIIDPMVTHWLISTYTPKRRFVCLQWEIPRSTAKTKIPKILQQFPLLKSRYLEPRYQKFVKNLPCYQN